MKQTTIRWARLCAGYVIYDALTDERPVDSTRLVESVMNMADMTGRDCTEDGIYEVCVKAMYSAFLDNSWLDLVKFTPKDTDQEVVILGKKKQVRKAIMRM